MKKNKGCLYRQKVGTILWKLACDDLFRFLTRIIEKGVHRSIFGDKATYLATVKRWYDDRCRMNFEKFVQQFCSADTVRHVIYREIEASLNISGTSIHSILRKHFSTIRFLHVGYRII